MTQVPAKPRPACATCPWRRSTPKRGFPGGFLNLVGLARALEGINPAMACHCKPDSICVGFAVRLGERSPSFRAASLLHLLDAYDPRPKGLLTVHQLVKKHGGWCEGQTMDQLEQAIRVLLLEEP